jgi:hypothetical protein
MWIIPDESKIVQALPCLLTWTIIISSFMVMMAISSWLIIASVADHRENAMFCLLLWSFRETRHLCYRYQSDCRNCSCDCHVGPVRTCGTLLGNMRYVQVIKHSSVASTCCCYYHLGTVGMWCWCTLCRVLQLLVTANIVPSSLILVTLMMEVRHSSETSVPTREPHGVTSQKIAFFVVTTVKTSNLTKDCKYFL